MQNPLKKIIVWVADALVEKITEPIDTINKRLDKLERLCGKNQSGQNFADGKAAENHRSCGVRLPVCEY